MTPVSPAVYTISFAPQPAKVSAPLLYAHVISAGSVTFCTPLVPLNASLPKTAFDDLISISSRELHPLKADVPTSVILDDSVTFPFSPDAPSKAYDPILVTLFGITISYRLDPQNALLYILVNPSGRLTSTMFLFSPFVYHGALVIAPLPVIINVPSALRLYVRFSPQEPESVCFSTHCA